MADLEWQPWTCAFTLKDQILTASNASGGTVNRIVKDQHVGATLSIDVERSFATIRPGDFEIALYFVQMRIVVGVEPDANGARRAHKFAINDLEAARIARVFGIVALVEIAVDASERPAHFWRKCASLLRNGAYTKDFAFGQGGNESDVFAFAVDFYDMD